jgi:hypothetical protein
VYSFLVLGIIPGTHIQIDFELWLIGMLVIALLAMIALRYFQNRTLPVTRESRTPFFAHQVHLRI